MILDFLKNFFCKNKKPIVNSTEEEKKEEKPPVRKKYLKVRDGENGDYYTLEKFSELVKIIKEIDTTSLFNKKLFLKTSENIEIQYENHHHTSSDIWTQKSYNYKVCRINRMIEQLKLDDLKKILNMRFEIYATQEKDAFELVEEVGGLYYMMSIKYPYDCHFGFCCSYVPEDYISKNVIFFSFDSSSCKMQRCNYDLKYISIKDNKYCDKLWSIYSCSNNIMTFCTGRLKDYFECSINYNKRTQNIALVSSYSIFNDFCQIFFEKKVEIEIPNYSSKLKKIQLNCKREEETTLKKKIVNEEIDAFLHSI